MTGRYKRIVINGKSILEHRYIMQQYIGRELHSYEQVHHINGNRFDNRIENLMIVTQKEHDEIHKWKYSKTKHCVICGKEFEPYESKRKAGKVCSKECKIKLDIIHASKRKRPIVQMDMNGNTIQRWDSARDCMNNTGFFESNICKCCNGKICSYKGYVWKYA
ncbi:MAG: HNH endonuclease signature motif containing protein [Ruminococcus sp.]